MAGRWPRHVAAVAATAVLAAAPAAAAAPVAGHRSPSFVGCPRSCAGAATALGRARLRPPVQRASPDRAPGENEGMATVIGIALVIVATLWGLFGWLGRKPGTERRKQEAEEAQEAPTHERPRVVPLRGNK